MSHPSAFCSLLPTDVAIAESLDRTSREWHEGPLPEEALSVANAVASRREEFTAGRNLARTALRIMGRTPCSIAVGPCGEPVFPAGLSGSITHTRNYCAVAVMCAQRMGFVGIDAEEAVPLMSGVEAYVLTPDERRIRYREDALHGTRLFAAKEAFYKAFFQVCGVFIDFQEVEVTMGNAPFDLHLRVHRIGASKRCDRLFSGRQIQDEQRVYSAVLLNAEDARALRGHFTGSLHHRPPIRGSAICASGSPSGGG
jgi:4'-phosphopantetheinyl transferase EntD